jgi:hypothetical protein
MLGSHDLLWGIWQPQPPTTGKQLHNYDRKIKSSPTDV